MPQTSNSFFNLIVRANPDWPMSTDRMLEGSSEDVKAIFAPNNYYDLAELASLPTIMVKEFREDDTKTYAMVGYVDEPSLNPRMTHPVMIVPATVLISCGIVVGRWGGSRTRWSVLKGNPFKILAPYSFSRETSVYVGERGDLLGHGGFGEVYKYHHSAIDLDFAVKVFSPMFLSKEEEVEAEKRFFREAKMLFMLNHPNIVRIYDVGRIGESPYIKMELVDGEDLYKLQSERGVLQFNDAEKVVSQVLKGLQHAHDHNIIHRDLKPSNVMVKDNNGFANCQCKVIDFGVSAFMDTEAYTKLTRTGECVAGGSYTDPVLERRPSLRDPRSDIYSAGAILYFLLCGHSPGPDAEVYLRMSNVDLTDEQIKAVMKALATDMNQRYETCDEMRRAVEAACN